MSFFNDHRLDHIIFDNKIFSVHVRGMRTTGYLIDKNQNLALCRFWLSAFLTFSIAFSCFLQLVVAVQLKGSESMSSATALLYLSTSIAISNAFFRRKRLATMLTFIQDDVDKFAKKSDDREEQLFRKTISYIRTITTCIWTPSVVAGIIAYIDAFYRFAFNPDSIFNLEQVRNGTDTDALLIKLFPFREIHDDLLLGYILPMYSLFLGITSIPLWHTYITSLMSYVNLKCELIHKRISEMDVSKVFLLPSESRYYSTLVDENDRRNYLRLKMCKFCVDEQVRVRWIVSELQELIYIPVIADFLIFSVLICFLFYEIALENPSNMDFLFMCLYLFVMSSILWLYHWHATLIKENSALISYAIYSCDWYNYPIYIQKTILLIMKNSSTPLEINAVFVSLNLATFIDIMRASYSYFNLLRNTS